MAPRPPIQVKVVPQEEFDPTRRNWALAFFDPNGDPIENMDGIPVPGPAGDDGADGMPHILVDADGTEFAALEKVKFNQGWVTNDVGDGVSEIDIDASLGRRRNNFNNVIAAGLVANAHAQVDLDTLTFAAWRIYKITAGARAVRARLYATDAHREADLARPVGEDPTGDHGMFLEVVLAAGEDLILSPLVDAFNDDSPGGTEMYWTLTNLGATGDTDVTLVYRGTEDPPPTGG